MIRQMSFTVVFIFASLVGLIIGSRLIGSTQPEPDVLTRVFSTANGNPCVHWCLFGAMPVSMTGIEEVSTLDRHLVTRNMKKTLVGSIGPNNYRVDYFAREVLISVDEQGLWVSLSYDNWYTDSQRFSVPDWIQHPVYVGDIIARYAHDKTLKMNAQINGDRLRLTYANDDTRLLFMFQLADPYRIQPHDKLVYIGVSDRSHELPVSSRIWKEWYGFTTLDRYLPIFTN